MNREIKFRAWDQLSKCFIYPNSPSRQHHFISLSGSFINFQNGSGGNEYVLQQFTGLLDKNGKEIYEGDICNIRRYEHLDKTKTWIKGEVLWGCEHGWVFRSYYNDNKNGDFYGTRFVEANGIEIIGNIFENPELLNNATP